VRTLILFMVSAMYVFPQCSDAGICSISGHQQEEMNNLTLSLSYQYGYSGKNDDITYGSILLDGKYYYSGSSFVLISVPYNNQSGPLGSTSGIGDIILLGSQNIYTADEFNLSLQGGVKLATGDENKDNLPQNYQSGLGTNDILLGLSASYVRFHASIGYQIAGGRNDNIQKVERGDDLLFSAGYSHNLSESVTGGLQFLVIKRLGETSIADPAAPESYIKIPESDNLQINGALTLNYNLSESIGLNLFGAVPFRKRPVNTDGLTRSLSLSAGINWFM
jgi:hypothetical protein